MSDEIPALPWGTKKKDVAARKELIAKYVAQGNTKAEAERLMLLAIFRRHVRYYMNVKKIPHDRLVRAVDEAMVEEVQES